MVLTMLVPPGPDCTRAAHAAMVEPALRSVTGITVSPRALRQGGPATECIVTALGRLEPSGSEGCVTATSSRTSNSTWEKIMRSKDTSTPTLNQDNRVLADTELAAVTGGMLNLGATRASTAPQSTDQLTQMLQQLLQLMR